ncbi:MAG TPA: DUF2807 domain-containing protein [Sphingobacteriaceae bacterium]
MKTTIGILSKALIPVLVLIIFTGSRKPAKAAEINTSRTTILADIRGISRIEVSGNVELLLNQAVKEQVDLYGKRDSRKRNIRFEDGVLQIHSQDEERITVVVGVNNLQSVDASGKAVVRSLNRLSSIDLDICLKDHARGSVDAEALNFTAILEGSAQMDLTGQAENQTIRMSEASQLEAPEFEAQSRTLTISDAAVASLGNTRVKTTAVAGRFAGSF